MADALIPGLSEPASLLRFEIRKDVYCVVASRENGMPRLELDSVVVSARHCGIGVTMGKFVLACGEAVEPAGASEPPNLWVVSNATVEEQGGFRWC